MEICGTDAEWKRDTLSLGEVNRASSDHDGTRVYVRCAMKNRKNKINRPCEKNAKRKRNNQIEVCVHVQEGVCGQHGESGIRSLMDIRRSSMSAVVVQRFMIICIFWN